MDIPENCYIDVDNPKKYWVNIYYNPENNLIVAGPRFVSRWEAGVSTSFPSSIGSRFKMHYIKTIEIHLSKKDLLAIRINFYKEVFEYESKQ